MLRQPLRLVRAGESTPVPSQRAAREHDADRLAEQALKDVSGGGAAQRTPDAATDVPSRRGTAPGMNAQPLPDALRADMEQRFGTSFASVRISADARADRIANAFHARAFTSGEEIGFAASEFAPQSTRGRRLIAHELGHVMQERRGGPRGLAFDGIDAAGLDSEVTDLRQALNNAADAAARKPLVTQADSLRERLVAALNAAKTAEPPSGGDPGQTVREALKKLSRGLVESGETDAAVELAKKVDDPEVRMAVVNALRGASTGVAGQQRFLSKIAPIAGQKLTAGDAQHSQQWLKTNTPAIGKTLSKLDDLGMTGLKRESAALELSEGVLSEYYVHSDKDEKPDPLGDPTAATLHVDSSSNQIKADCDVYATYGARLLREQGWETAGYLSLIPDEPDLTDPTKRRDAHAVALARKAADPGDPTRGHYYIGIGNQEIRELVGHGLALSSDANALPFLTALAMDAYATPTPQRYDLYYMAAGPGGAYDPKLLDPKNNGLTPYRSVAPAPASSP